MGHVVPWDQAKRQTQSWVNKKETDKTVFSLRGLKKLMEEQPDLIELCLKSVFQDKSIMKVGKLLVKLLDEQPKLKYMVQYLMDEYKHKHPTSFIPDAKSLFAKGRVDILSELAKKRFKLSNQDILTIGSRFRFSLKEYVVVIEPNEIIYWPHGEVYQSRQTLVKYSFYELDIETKIHKAFELIEMIADLVE